MLSTLCACNKDVESNEKESVNNKIESITANSDNINLNKRYIKKILRN